MHDQLYLKFIHVHLSYIKVISHSQAIHLSKKHCQFFRHRPVDDRSEQHIVVTTRHESSISLWECKQVPGKAKGRLL